MIINLYKNTNLDNTYQHTVCFNNKNEQTSWFNTKLIGRYESNFKEDSYLSKMLVEGDFFILENVDYASFTKNNKTYYYFINSVSFKTNSVVELDMEIDVIQTYLFDVDIKESFIVRSHVQRWNGEEPVEWLEEEGVQLGEYVLSESTKLYDFKNQYLITSSSPLGKIDYSKKDSSQGGGDGITPSKGNWREGVLSSEIFRFLKGYEGFAPRPYDDGLGYMTIGYGVTKHGEPDVYNKLLQKVPLSETEASKVAYDLKIQRYGKPIVNACINLGVTLQRQFDALLDLAYNAGTGVITGDNDLTRIIKQDPSNETSIRKVWENFRVNAGTSTEAGLRLRRKAECDIYFKGKYEMRPILIVVGTGKYDGTVTANNGNGWLPT